jgi:hypothetical protein
VRGMFISIIPLGTRKAAVGWFSCTTTAAAVFVSTSVNRLIHTAGLHSPLFPPRLVLIVTSIIMLVKSKSVTEDVVLMLLLHGGVGAVGIIRRHLALVKGEITANVANDGGRMVNLVNVIIVCGLRYGRGEIARSACSGAPHSTSSNI